MLHKIYKYPISEELPCVVNINLPKGARILHWGRDPGGMPCIWAVVDIDAPPKSIAVVIVGTGFGLPHESAEFIGTIHDGPFMWHGFVVRNLNPQRAENDGANP